MKPAETLERLEKAKQMIEALPPDTKILSVEIDGLNFSGRKTNNMIHLATPFQQLAEKGFISGGWAIKDDPERDFIEESILTGGFILFNLIEKEKAAPGVTSTEDGTAEQDPTKNNSMIDQGKEEVKQ